MMMMLIKIGKKYINLCYLSKGTIPYDYNKVLTNTIDVQDKYIDVEATVQDMYVDKQDGLDDDMYDEELDVPSEEDLPISKAKVTANNIDYEINESLLQVDFNSFKAKT